MKIYYSDLCLLGGEPEKNIRLLSEYGAQHIELMMDGSAWDDFPAKTEDILSILRKFPVHYGLHSPCWDVNLTSENHDIRKASLSTCISSVEFAAKLGCSHLVVHPGFCQAPAFNRSVAAQRSKEALAILCRHARVKGVLLAVENVGYNGTSLYTEDGFARLLDGFGEEIMYLLDVGHAVLNKWDPAAMVRRLGRRICGLHLHDNDGLTDSHLPIGDGITQWEPLLEEAARLPDSCSFILEYNIGTPLEELQRSKLLLTR